MGDIKEPVRPERRREAPKSKGLKSKLKGVSKEVIEYLATRQENEICHFGFIYCAAAMVLITQAIRMI
jgi:hypothetical protein